jgi:NAD(P)-dependent dehydrogenase (short-subunit alcohol dehydrogenase family)
LNSILIDCALIINETFHSAGLFTGKTIMTGSHSGLAAFKLNGQVALITGGGSGIGRASAMAMVSAGASVCVMDQNREAGQAVVDEIVALGDGFEKRAVAVAADVTQEDQVEAAVAQAIKQLGGLTILVNCAGIAIREATIDLPLEDWQKVLDVNLTGVFLCARHGARKMLEAKQGGSIINVASIMGLSGGGLYANISYQSTKGAIVNMTRALAVEWAADNIRVNAVAPTWVNTPFISGLTAEPALMAEMKRVTPLGRLADPEEVANAILYLASPASAMVTGHILAVDGGFLAQ